MGRFELALHKLAAPGNAPTTGRSGEGPFFDPGHLVVGLPGGLVAKVSGDAIAVSKASASLLHRLGAPPPDSLAGIAFQASELRRLRPLLHTRAAIAVRGTRLPDHHLLGPGGLVGEIPGPLRRLPRFSYPPTANETAIEAPYRLVISPGSEARWLHVNEPSAAADAPRHVELWHTRLGNARQAADGTISGDERIPAAASSARFGPATATPWPRTIGRTRHRPIPSTATTTRFGCRSIPPIATCWCGNRRKRWSATAAASIRYQALKTLPLAVGEAPAPGQTVVHDVDELGLPYLPDPMARGLSIVFTGGGPDRALPFPFGVEGFTAAYGALAGDRTVPAGAHR